MPSPGASPLGEFDSVLVEINPNDRAAWTNKCAQQEADIAGTTANIEHTQSQVRHRLREAPFR